MKRRLVLFGALAGLIPILAIAAFMGWPWRSAGVGYAEVNEVTPSAVSTYLTGVAVQNLNASASAAIQIDFYGQNGVLVAGASISAVLDPGGQRSWVTTGIANLPNGFKGSAVVSSDQPVAAIVNTQTSNPGTVGTDPFRIGTSLGVDTPATKVYGPQVMKNYYNWNSIAYAQNTSGSSADITATIIGADGLVKSVQTFNVAAYAMKDFVQSTNADLPNGFVGSIVLESTAPIAVTINFFNNATATGAGNDEYKSAQYHSYNAMASGGTKLYVPRLVRKYYDYNGGLKVQNIGTAQTRVRVTYNIGASIGVTQEVTIQPKQAWGPYMGADNQVPTGLASGTGSAIIESLDGQSIIAIVNEDNRELGQGVTYNAIVDGSQSNTLSLPQVTSRFYGYASGLQFMNVGSSAANGTITLSKTGKTLVVPFTNIAPGQSFSLFAPNVADPASEAPSNAPDAHKGKLWNFNGSAVIQSTNGQALVGIVNQSFRADYDFRYATKYGDSYTMGNALNR